MKTSIKTTARIGGWLYLINIALGFFAIGYVPGLLIVTGDPAATSRNVLTHEPLYRWGLAAHSIILLTNIPLAVIFYRLFKIVNKNAALLVVFFTLTGTAIEAVNLLNPFASLVLLKNAYIQKVFSQEQIQALSYTLHQLEGIGFNLALVFFGFYCITIGYLIFRSTFLPRITGILMATGGLCYLINSFAGFLSPAFAAGLFPFIQLPSGLAELTFCVCLIIIGVNLKRWQEKARASQISAGN